MNRLPYQYVVLRCVPRVDREEFLNVGVVLYCEAADFLDAAWQRRPRPAAGAGPSRRPGPGLRRPGRSCEGVCAGDERGGPAAAEQSAGTRFGFLKAPRSTVVQPGPVHGGVTDDPARQLERLLSQLVADPS